MVSRLLHAAHDGDLQMRFRMTGMAIAVTAMLSVPAGAQTPGERLVRAYPDHLEKVDGNDLVWKDGTRMPIDDGRGAKSFEQWLASPDLKDMLKLPYPEGDAPPPASPEADPGRARNAAFFNKMYGDCTKGQVTKSLVEVFWLPKKARQKLRISKINDVAGKLAAVSKELDELPASFDVFLKPSEGTYNCRAIAGTTQISGHGYGIAIDIATKHAHYWRWSKGGYQNKIPMEIVRVFEKHGFIWGGKWGHYDTMHFEYRPELLPTAP